MRTISQLVADLDAGAVTSEALVEECLAAIEAPTGEGQAAFIAVEADKARETARAMDALRRVGAAPSEFAGIPVSVKDLFDVRGQVTRAGSVVLEGPPAARDATAVARWRRAGLVIVGRTNMTEFAFSGLGLNPHYGTPANPWERRRRRIPGGSSSGAAISITDQMAFGALGSDTGGSCRIPAALCGIAGFKPTQARIPRDGMVPLSDTLDAVGVLGGSVGCCAALAGIAAGQEPQALEPPNHAPRLAAVQNYLLGDAEPEVLVAYDRTVDRLRMAGAQVSEVEWPELDDIPQMNATGGFAAAESFTWHTELMSERGQEYDPRVLSRIRRGEAQTARDMIELRRARAELIASVTHRLSGFDALICPTVPLLAPPIEVMADDAEYTRANLLMLRNPSVVNLLDGCAVSIPMHLPGEPPTGLTVAGLAGADPYLLNVAYWMEERLCP